jgi:hypothetical protein
MQVNYALYVRHEAYDVIRAGSRAARDRIVAFIESLPSHPFQSGDYSETDATGRDCQVKIIGKYAVYFWTDHAVKEVKVVDIVDADQK